MDSVPLTEARRTLGDIADEARLRRVSTSLTDHGKPAAVVIAPETYEEYQRLRDAEDRRQVEAGIEEIGQHRAARFTADEFAEMLGTTLEDLGLPAEQIARLRGRSAA